MDLLAAVNLSAAITTIAAAILVASNLSPRIMIAGFSVFIVASLLWMFSGYIDNKTSLLVQNAVLLVVNITGIYRWIPKV